MTLVHALVGVCGVLALVVGVLGWVLLRVVRQLTRMNSLLLVAATGGRTEETARALTMLTKQMPPPQEKSPKLEGVAKGGLTLKMGTL